MLIGIDFDNTIVCYDRVFRMLHSPSDTGEEGLSMKEHFAEALRKKPGGEWQWSLLQGEIYGPMLQHAQAYPGFIQFAAKQLEAGNRLAIVSHKSTFPTAGKAYPLVQYAKDWILKNLAPLISAGLSIDNDFYFEETLDLKLSRIKQLGCTYFIDDLASVLTHPTFPKKCKGVHFSKQSQQPIHFYDWSNTPELTNSAFEGTTNQAAQSTPSEVLDCAKRLFKNNEIIISPLSGATNCSAFKVTFKDTSTCFLKKYKNDNRGRLEREVAFLEYAQAIAPDDVPSVLAADPTENILCLSFIDGDSYFESSDVPIEAWQACLQFFLKLQTNADTAKLLPSSEGAASLQEHLGNISKRRNKWLLMAQNQQTAPTVASWITEELEPVYQEIAQLIINSPLFKSRLDRHDLLISPSDFGIHNTKIRKNGRLSFFDFEYAGWDDPAKTLADFFYQPRLPPPPSEYKTWKAALTKALLPENSRSFLIRLPLVDICCGLKWIFIILANQSVEPNSKQAASKLIQILTPRLKELQRKLAELNQTHAHAKQTTQSLSGQSIPPSHKRF